MWYEVLMWAVAAHMIGDFALQSRWVAENKSKSWYILMAHSMIWAACVALPFKLFGYNNITALYFLLASGHFVIDDLKCKMYKTEKDNWMLYPDQFLHLIQILVVMAIGSIK
jgi:hypothetical protein